MHIVLIIFIATYMNQGTSDAHTEIYRFDTLEACQTAQTIFNAEDVGDHIHIRTACILDFDRLLEER